MRLHYLVANKLDLTNLNDFAYDVSKYDDINELYIISDILVTDYSSVFFDYANLKRPILFYMYDLKEYQCEIRDFYIDLGMSSKEEVLKNNISIGDFISPDTKTEILNDDKIVGKALDDRICVASIISALKYMKQYHLKTNIVAIFSAQEEVGARGAKVASYKVNSDVSVALDVTDSFDTPTSTKDDVKIGNGVALSLIDGGTIAHKGLFNYLKSLMIKNNFNFNFDPMTIGGTDSQVINITKSGIINLTISLPIRYMHSFYSVASLKDLNTLKRLIILISKDLNYQKLNKIKEFKYQKISK